MKIYTRTGDGGETGLLAGGRVPKHHLRIAAYGDVDELNACLGLCAAAAGEGRMRERLEREMNRLFALGSHLAVTPNASPKVAAQLPAWDPEAVAGLERDIDEVEKGLPALKNFILPGGSELSARLHLARTVCRRAERSVCALAESESVDLGHLAYLNRLSDWLFTLAREANREAGVGDAPWQESGPFQGA